MTTAATTVSTTMSMTTTAWMPLSLTLVIKSATLAFQMNDVGLWFLCSAQVVMA